MRILLATPAFNGIISTRYLDSFVRTMAAVTAAGHQLTLVTADRDGLVSLARNGCANAALENGFDKLLFVDADIVWRPDHVMTLLKSTRDVIGGTYPYKGHPMKLVFNAKPQEAIRFGQKTQNDFSRFMAEEKTINPDWNGELEVDHIPTGFMLIDTKVFKALAKVRPKYIRQGIPGSKSKEEYDFFRIGLMKLHGRTVYETEDFGFCNLLKENGFKVYLHTKVIVKHLGYHEFDFLGATSDLPDSL